MMSRLLLSGIVVLLSLGATFGSASGGETEIVTTGVGVATAQPDYANVIVSIRKTAKTATESTRQAAATYQRLVSGIEAHGVSSSDVTTEQFSVAEDWKRDDHGTATEFIGYVTRHQLRIRVNDRDKVGEVIDAAMGAGTRSIDKIHFASTKADSAQRVALATAVRDAQARAEIMAAAAGGRLGPLIDLTTEDAVRARGGELRVDRSRGAADAILAPPESSQSTLVPGPLTQRVVVVGTWQLLKDE